MQSPLIKGKAADERAEPSNMMPKPTSQKHGVPMQKSIMFFIRMLPVFFAGQASFAQSKACLHSIHQNAGHQHPDDG